MHEFDEADEDERPMAAELRTAKERGPRQFTVLIDDPSTAGGIPDPAYPVGIFEVWMFFAGREFKTRFKKGGINVPQDVSF